MIFAVFEVQRYMALTTEVDKLRQFLPMIFGVFLWFKQSLTDYHYDSYNLEYIKLSVFTCDFSFAFFFGSSSYKVLMVSTHDR